MLLDLLAANVGTAVTRAVLKLWMGDAAADVGGAVTDSLLSFLPGQRERRRALNQVAGIAEEVAANLAPFIETEFPQLPENERLAAVIAVGESLDALPFTSQLLVTENLDPARLELLVRARAGRKRTKDLSAEGVALYDHVLRESCNYIVEIVITLPSFTPEALREILVRETQLIELVSKVLDKLPPPLEVAGATDAGFESEYRRQILRRLDRLELFGVDVSELSRRYALSVAYITLTARKGSVGPAPAAEGDEKVLSARDVSDDGTAYLPVDLALDKHRRVLIKGEAGSGKTTLLQWLAVNSARDSFDEALDDWNRTAPLFIQLRRYVGHRLPAPEAFVEHVARNIAAEMPAAWVHRQLNAGRALVLIDGVDEVPEGQREETREWLEDLVETYPDARYVITSRPPAVRDGWLDACGFEEIELQPMTITDIDAFVEHWHDAAASAASDSDDAQELPILQRGLKSAIRQSQQLRSLATSPLLCAMLCALNRDRKTQLPEDRMDLYRIALESLLARRDTERRVAEDRRVKLSLRQKLAILEHLAQWLLLNEQSDIETATGLRLIEEKTKGMTSVTAPPEQILKYLLERSGVLRQPVEGRIDFIHRTFQEYLGAHAIVASEHIPLLIEKAFLDQWREVVILAAGHSRPGQCHELIEGLIEAGDADPELRHRLHLLAVACLETAIHLDPEMIGEVTERLKRLVPPTSMSEARSLASAGSLVPPLLREYRAERVQVVAACIRALALVASDDSLAVLATFGRDKRVTVVRELIRAWSSFDAEEFAARVIADSPLEGGVLSLRDPNLIAGVRHLKHLRDLRVEVRGKVEALASAPNKDVVRSVTIGPARRLKTLDTVAELSNLRELYVQSCPQLSEINALGGLAKLRVLDLTAAGRLTSVAPLRGLREIRWLRLMYCTELRSIDGIQDAINLEYLDLDSCERVTDLAPIASLRDLKHLDLRGCVGLTSFDALKEVTKLETLHLTGCGQVEELAWLSAAERVRRLFAQYCQSLRSLDGLQTARLESLDLTGCTSLTNASVLSGARALTRLSLRSCPGIEDLSWIRGCKRLAQIDISGCSAVQELGPLETLRNARITVDETQAHLLSPEVIERNVIRSQPVISFPR